MLLPASLMGCVSKAKDVGVGNTSSSNEKFTFAFFTDVHLHQGNSGDGDNGLRKALVDAQQRNVDFILFGGDSVDVDHLQKDEKTADEMYTHLKNILSECPLLTYFTMGNHDRFYYTNGEPDKTGFKMFEKHMGPSHRSFDHKGVHFVILNSMDLDENGSCCVGPEQLEWLRSDLEKAGKETPVVVSLHIPCLSLYYPVVEGNFKGYDMITNTKQVVDLLRGYNVKVVLQGHQHIYEEIKERHMWFVTGGGISASWWGGPLMETEEGYMLIHVAEDNTFTWEYIDYGWEVKKA